MSTIAQYEWRNAKGILLAMAGVGSGFIVFIGAGFRINEPTTPEPFDTLFYPAIVVFALVVGYGLRSLWQSGGGIRVPRAAYRWGARRKLARERRAWAEERRQRLARLAADPRLSKYVPLIEKGESWNDDQIAYNEDRTRTVTCVHLAPIERAMREANLDVRLLFKAHIQSPCLIDEPELTRRFGPIAPARYSEFMTGERAIEDTPNAVLGCSTCDSGIRTRHRLEATLQTPVFPSPVS